MSYPMDLINVRHGEAESNIAQAASEKGDDSYFTDAYRARHASEHRLTHRGREQIATTGAWLKAEGLHLFDEAYCSDYTRSLESAGHLDLDVRWTPCSDLRERDVGLMEQLPFALRQSAFPDHIRQAKMNPFYWRPPAGESIADVVTRLQAGIIGRLRVGDPERRIILVNHGRTAQALCVLLKGMPPWIYNERHASHDPQIAVRNAQIHHFTRRHPRDPQQVTEEFSWMRTIVPWNLAATDSCWKRIERVTYSSEELKALVQRYPQLIGR